eukprot:m.295067 g.295067  ORF g.295067 m.295067 type:complete len:405 (-) comp20037_c0_seq2:526-1740(-)
MPNVAYLRMPQNAHSLAVKTIHPKYLKKHVARLGEGEIDEAACNAAWFQPQFTREQVKNTLSRAPNGSFVISQRPQDPDWKFHLSLKSGRQLSHFVVINGSFGFTFKGVQLAFPTLSDFIAYYSRYESSLPVRLFTSPSAAVQKPQMPSQRRASQEKDMSRTSHVSNTLPATVSVDQGTDAVDLSPRDDLLDGKDRSHDEELYLVLQEGIKRGWFGVEDLPYTLGGPVPRRTFQAPASPTLRQQQESQAFMRAAVAAMASASHPKHAFTQSNSHPKYNFARDMDASRQSRHTGARETTAPHPQDQHQWQAPPPARDPTSQATHQRIGASITPPAGNGTRYLFYTVVSSTGGCCAEKNALGAVRLYSVLARHSISFYFIYCATSCQMLISTVCLYCDSEQSWRRN